MSLRLAQHDEVVGIFRPRRSDNLQPGVERHIGARLTWTVAWPIEAGPYAGQFALLPNEELSPRLGWVPEEDVQFDEERAH